MNAGFSLCMLSVKSMNMVHRRVFWFKYALLNMATGPSLCVATLLTDWPAHQQWRTYVRPICKAVRWTSGYRRCATYANYLSGGKRVGFYWSRLAFLSNCVFIRLLLLRTPRLPTLTSLRAKDSQRAGTSCISASTFSVEGPSIGLCKFDNSSMMCYRDTEQRL